MNALHLRAPLAGVTAGGFYCWSLIWPVQTVILSPTSDVQWAEAQGGSRGGGPGHKVQSMRQWWKAQGRRPCTMSRL